MKNSSGQDSSTETNVQKPRIFAFISKKEHLLVVFLIVSCVVVIFNTFFLGSPVIGLVLSLVFFTSIGLVCGEVFFDRDPLLMKAWKGFFIILLIFTGIGTLALYFNVFNLPFSMISIMLVALLFSALLLRKKHSILDTSKPMKKPTPKLKHTIVVFFSIFLAAIVGASFYLLLGSRTGEPMFSVWYTVPVAEFLSLIFISILVLICLIFFHRNSSWNFILIISLSILFVSLYYVVWYPSLYGDPLDQLGIARWTARTGSIYGRDWMLSHGLWIDIVKYKGYSCLVALFARLFNFDVYWVHNISVPILWAFILPLSAYEITCVLINKPSSTYPKEALLAAFFGAFFFSDLILWGASPTPNTLSFLFLFFTLSIMLRWVSTGGKALLGFAALGSAVSFMTHPMPGIFAFGFLCSAVIFRKVKWTILKTVAIASLVFLYPFILGYGSPFTLQNLFSIQNFIEFEKTLITIPFIVGAVGFSLFLMQKNGNRGVASLLFASYALIIFECYITKFAMVTVLYGSTRILVISNFLLIPFLGFGCGSLLEVAGSKKLQDAVVSRMSNVKSAINMKTVAAIALFLLISLQSALTLYQAYPENEVGLAPTAYEVEAVYYLNSSGTRRFVVLSDTLFTNLAIGLLGEDYSYVGIGSGAAFGISDWSYSVQQLYLKMVKTPSIDVLKTGLDLAYAQTVYFVVSVRSPDFKRVVTEASQIVEVDKVFGDGKLYVFKYPTPIAEGSGPKVKVIYDGGAMVEEVESKYSYMVKSSVSYSINLTGHTSYNITNYPTNWCFQSLTINWRPTAFDNASDINSFILIKDQDPTNNIRVLWLANDNFPICGWKEDSFKSGWAFSEIWQIEPMNFSDGNILSLSGNFTPGIYEDPYQDAYYVKSVNISTDEYPYMIVRWKSTDQVAVVYAYFGEPGQAPNQEIVSFNSFSFDWSVALVQLEPGREITYIMVGVTNLRRTDLSEVQTLYVDYILICNKG